MSDRYRPRPRSPPLQSLGRSSLPVVGYYNNDRHAVPTRREILATPRSSGPVVTSPIVTETTYRIKPETLGRRSSLRDNSRTRRSTLESQSRPKIVMAPEKPRHAHVHGASVRPPSPLQNPYRSSDEGGEYYTMPASSSGHRGHRRQAYSTTMDNADLNRLSRERESGAERLHRVGSGREGQMYSGSSRSRQVYSSGPRRKDSLASDYDEDGYGYTNPKDLVQYDLNRTEPKYPSRRDSYEGPRPARPSSIGGFQDVLPRSYDNRERGPPPSTRGFDKIPSRAPAYDATPTVRMPMPPGPGDISTRPTIVDPYYDMEPPRRTDSRSGRRPVSLYQEQDRRRAPRDYDPRDDDLRDRSEKPQRAPRYDEGVEARGFGLRTDRPEDNGFEKKKDHDKRRDRDYDRKDERKDDRKDDYDDYDDRERKGSRGGKLAAGLGLAGAAMGINAARKESRDDDSDEREDPRRRRDIEEHRRKRDSRDDRDTIDLSGRDPKERHASRDDRDLVDDNRESTTRGASKAEKPEFIDLSGRNPQERRATRDDKDLDENLAEPRERRRLQKKPPVNGAKSDSSEVSPDDDEPNGHRSRRDRPPREKAAAFNPKDTMDLRALKEALNKQDSPTTAPSISPKESLIKEPLREGSFERKKPRDLENVDTLPREDRGRHSHSDSDTDRRDRHIPRVVSPPRNSDLIKKPEEKAPVKGILRQPREKFPEDPSHIREGVAPLKGANKDIPPDKRWTKIDRRLVNPDALEAGKERYEARDDFVIVLRVLSKEEIQAYAVATQQIRGMSFVSTSCFQYDLS